MTVSFFGIDAGARATTCPLSTIAMSVTSNDDAEVGHESAIWTASVAGASGTDSDCDWPVSENVCVTVVGGAAGCSAGGVGVVSVVVVVGVVVVVAVVVVVDARVKVVDKEAVAPVESDTVVASVPVVPVGRTEKSKVTLVVPGLKVRSQEVVEPTEAGGGVGYLLQSAGKDPKPPIPGLLTRFEIVTETVVVAELPVCGPM